MCAVVALVACPAGADIINGSFETGDFTGWLKQEARGAASVVPGGTDGSWMAEMELHGEYVERPGGTVFAPALVCLFQELTVPGDAQFLVFDAWVEGFSTIRVFLSVPDSPEVLVSANGPTTYVVPVAGVQEVSTFVNFLARDEDVGTNRAYLDHVRFTDIAEPSSAALLASGVLWAAIALQRTARV